MGKKPDFILRAKHPEIKSTWLRVGAGWNNDGNVSIDLDPFVVLRGVDQPTLVLVPNRLDEDSDE